MELFFIYFGNALAKSASFFNNVSKQRLSLRRLAPEYKARYQKNHAKSKVFILPIVLFLEKINDFTIRGKNMLHKYSYYNFRYVILTILKISLFIVIIFLLQAHDKFLK